MGARCAAPCLFIGHDVNGTGRNDVEDGAGVNVDVVWAWELIFCRGRYYHNTFST